MPPSVGPSIHDVSGLAAFPGWRQFAAHKEYAELESRRVKAVSPAQVLLRMPPLIYPRRAAERPPEIASAFRIATDWPTYPPVSAIWHNGAEADPSAPESRAGQAVGPGVVAGRVLNIRRAITGKRVMALRRRKRHRFLLSPQQPHQADRRKAANPSCGALGLSVRYLLLPINRKNRSHSSWGRFLFLCGVYRLH